ncbi:hypothetical protein BVX95_01480 [archaeon D22]|nr:hypothetical protein BVX95_01480 [archaeon D22]
MANGHLSSLQYKHKFWIVIFNLSVACLLTTLFTVSFVTYNAFYVVFGEGFVTKPLVGLLFAMGIALIGVFFGVFRPIRVHVASIEDAMKGNA